MAAVSTAAPPAAGAVGSGIRRSRSEPQFRCASQSAPAPAPVLKSIRSVPLLRPAAPLPDQPPATASKNASGGGWVERLLEVRSRWRGKKVDLADHADADGGDSCCGCEVSYGEDEGGSPAAKWDRESFGRLLSRAHLTETRLFAQLAFLCNMAYVIPQIKVAELRRHYGLRFVTSSLEKKAEAGVITAKLDADSTRPLPPAKLGDEPEPRRPDRPPLAYGIAASAASYLRSRASGLLSLGRGRATDESAAATGSEAAACVAASTVTAVVAAEEAARLEAAAGLRSLQSSPCEWFVCDEADGATRCFVIQGSDSLASWQANLLFEPAEFEAMAVLVHRGIYEAAKGIYEQVLPDVESHLRRSGRRARLRFTGHSLGGSLALLVGLMLLARGAVRPAALLPVVTFGAPSVFCGGQRVLQALGVGEDHIKAVTLHRDIVPRAFSCSYPGHAVALLKRLNGAFRTHHCLNGESALYRPLGRTYIAQPDGEASPPHPLLPDGAGLYRLEADAGSGAMRAFLDSPHPLETLSDRRAYGAGGTILRDHESSSYFRALNAMAKQQAAEARPTTTPRLEWRPPMELLLPPYYLWPSAAGAAGKELVGEARG